jgi:site-specific recombinase XerD
MREKQPGVWEVRVLTGTDARGKRTQMSRTVRGGKRDAERLAASLEAGPGSASPAGRKASNVLDAWIDQNLDTWAPASARDQQSRVRSIMKDKIAYIPIAQLSIADVERWHTRLRRDGLHDAGIRNQHGALSAAFGQALRWGWVSQNVVAMAQRKTSKKQPRGVMSLDPDTLNAIRELRREREPYGRWMFGVGLDLVPPDHIGWWLTRARKMSGIDMKWRLHDLRHWSATISIGQGHDVRTVAGRLGHSNPAMTLRVYAHAFAAADQALAAGLGDLLRGDED